MFSELQAAFLKNNTETADFSEISAWKPPPGVTADFVNPPSISWQVIAVSVPFTAVASICVVLRIYTRGVLLRCLGIDDAFVVISMIIAWAFAACGIAAIPYGYGVDLWNLHVSDVITFLKIDLAGQVTYFLSTMFVKLSILLMYHRLNSDQTFRRIAYVIMAFDIIYSLLSCGIILFGCAPIAAGWDFTIPHTCVNRKAYYYAQANFNIISDFATLFLPVRMCLKLHLPSRQRWMLGLLFAIGSFASIVSIVRLITLLPILHSINFTLFKVQVGAWAEIELNTGIICACLPCLKPLLKKAFPRWMSSSSPVPAPSTWPMSRSKHSSIYKATRSVVVTSSTSFHFGKDEQEGRRTTTSSDDHSEIEEADDIELEIPSRVYIKPFTSTTTSISISTSQHKPHHPRITESSEAEQIKSRIRG